MRKTTRRAAALIATGAVGLGGLAVAAPAIADASSVARPAAAGSGPGPGWHVGGMGDQTGRALRDGSCGNLAVTAARGTMTTAQKSTPAAMAEEEKLAPGGSRTITPWCGKEATQAFATEDGRGEHSSVARGRLDDYLIGTATQ